MAFFISDPGITKKDDRKGILDFSGDSDEAHGLSPGCRSANDKGRPKVMDIFQADPFILETDRHHMITGKMSTDLFPPVLIAIDYKGGALVHLALKACVAGDRSGRQKMAPSSHAYVSLRGNTTSGGCPPRKPQGNLFFFMKINRYETLCICRT